MASTRCWLTFVVLGLGFFVFGSGSLNLFFRLKANTELLVEHGWQAAMDGAAQPLLELLIAGYVSMAVMSCSRRANMRWRATWSATPTNPSPRNPRHEDRSPAG